MIIQYLSTRMRKTEKIYIGTKDDIIYPNGKLKNGRLSKNYNHFNSIFKYKNDLHIIAHNETKKTNRKVKFILQKF